MPKLRRNQGSHLSEVKYTDKMIKKTEKVYRYPKKLTNIQLVA
jgi:hypothetical protein